MPLVSKLSCFFADIVLIMDIKVNINAANSEKLQTLPGVGPAMASKIIEYRNSKGKFKTIEDLKNVSGIGDNKFNKLKDYIVVN